MINNLLFLFFKNDKNTYRKEQVKEIEVKKQDVQLYMEQKTKLKHQNHFKQ